MTYRPNFAAYFVGKVRAGEAPRDEPGDLTVLDDGTTYIYRGLDARWRAAWFDWASYQFCEDFSDHPKRLVRRGDMTSFEVESGFAGPNGAPDADSEDYQAWLDDVFTPALLAWQAADRPAEG
jgi:hypothetical protein